MKTTKELRGTYKSLFADSQSPLAHFMKQILNDIESAEARVVELESEISRLQGVLRQLLASGLSLEALLSDEPVSLYIHTEIWAGLKEHRGHLRRALTLLTQKERKRGVK